MKVEPYLFLDGRCEEALDFYRETLGAKIGMMMRFKEMPEPHEPGMIPPGAEEKIMHADFHIGDSLIMVSDGRCDGGTRQDGFSLAITVPTVEEADRLFNALAASGTVQMPIAETFFSPRFGMVRDKFGVSWMILADGPAPSR
ncbi:MAG: VOC family protein [Candidatus Hydrogenedentes bacterium]|nr:VOC family protein [Candidatus Hydrogenedentota bacterium]